MTDIAIIGGTSLQNIQSLKIHETKKIQSVYGEVSCDASIGELNGKPIVFLIEIHQEFASRST